MPMEDNREDNTRQTEAEKEVCISKEEAVKETEKNLSAPKERVGREAEKNLSAPKGGAVQEANKGGFVSKEDAGEEEKISVSPLPLGEYPSDDEAIIYQLVNYENNSRILEKIPHIPYLDMAIIFRVRNEEDPRKWRLFLQEDRERMGCSLEEVEHRASYYTPRLFPVLFQPVREIIREFIGESMPEEEEGSHADLYVLTNREKCYGAAAILYPQVLWAISVTMKQDLYILPSSIHECMILPIKETESREGLQDIVQTINSTKMPKDEILSNHVFVYHKNGDILALN